MSRVGRQGIAIVAVLLAAGCAVRYPEVREVEVGGHRLWARVAGRGAPTVVFDAGLGESHETWSWVWQEVATFATVVVYDRAGLGRSEEGPSPRNSRRIAEELHRLLAALAVPRPYVLVGHSFGGLNVRLFASLCPDDVGGLVLVDPTPESFPSRSEALRSARERSRLRTALALAPRAAADEMASVARSVAEVTAAPPLPDVPVVVLSSTRPEESPAFRHLWGELQGDLARRLHAEHVVLERSGHYIQVDDPAAVVDAIRRVVSGLRPPSPPPGSPGAPG